MGTAMNEWVSVPDAAVLAQRDVSTVHKWIRQGALQARADGRGIKLVNVAAVLRVESEQKRGRPEGTAKVRGI